MSELPPEREHDGDKLIRLSIEEARREGEPITDQAARLIAGELHGGQATAMYSLASCGAIQLSPLLREVVLDWEDPNIDEAVKPWLRAISEYGAHHGDRGPVEGWFRLTSDEAVKAALSMHEQLGHLAVNETLRVPVENTDDDE